MGYALARTRRSARFSQKANGRRCIPPHYPAGRRDGARAEYVTAMQLALSFVIDNEKTHLLNKNDFFITVFVSIYYLASLFKLL
jgi:hypothetical protein